VTSTKSRIVPDTYLDCVRELPLRSIRSESELDAAEAMLHRLLARRLDRGGKQYLDALTDLIEVYEKQAHPIPDASEVDVLATLMESNGLSQSAVTRETGISQSTISAVLGGVRSLTPSKLS
jgi:antitoxin component HigA of HigAB toxin-antitoxin module